MRYNGVDVSELQGSVNWNRVGQSGINFAMVRATYDSSGIDSQFEKNMEGLSQTGINFGAYHQSAAQSVNEAVAEAEYFLNTVKKYDFSYPLALKIESEFDMQKGKDFFTDIIVAFLNTIKQSGYHPIVYLTPDMIENQINRDKISDFDIWLADLVTGNPDIPPYTDNVTIWQHSQRGSVPGIAGNANLDISFVDYPSIIKKRMSGGNISNMTESKNIEPDFNEPTFYTVEKGDTLRNIAKKIFGDPEQYRRLMELNNLTRPIIFAGQTLRIPQTVNSDIMSYRVVAGDTLWKIAERFLGYGPRYEEIMRLNKLTSDMIYPGQILKIRSEQHNSPEYYTVQKGDTLWKIAQNHLGNGNRYTEIMRANNLKNGNLRVGQALLIPQIK